MADCHADVISLADEREQRQAFDLIGSPGELTRAAELDALPVWSRWADEILSIVRASDGPTETGRLLGQWSERAREDLEIVASLGRVTLTADMGGQLFVRLVEVPESVPASFALDAVTLPPFLRMEFAEAIAAFLAREVVTPEEFAALTDAARFRSFTATRLAADGLVERVKALIADHLARGGTFADFQRALGPDTLGITAASPWYLETIYRTNTQAAYGAGRLRQLSTPIVMEARPFVEYRTAGDNRVRPSHAALDRVLFDQRDPAWQRFAPPNGYNCRCAVVAVRDPDRARLRDPQDIPADAQPDDGFNAPPTGDEV